jgi:hypothetical protein
MRRSGQPRTPRGAVAAALTCADAPAVVSLTAAAAQTGADGGWVDGDRSLYRRRGSPSPDRYHGHHGIQTIVRDVGLGGGWPTLTKTNYVEWAAVMRVRLQVRHMWEAV